MSQEEQEAKAKGLLRLRAAGVLQVFNCYGLGVFIPAAAEQVAKLAEQFYNDMPVRVEEAKLVWKENPDLTRPGI